MGERSRFRRNRVPGDPDLRFGLYGPGAQVGRARRDASPPGCQLATSSSLAARPSVEATT